MLKRKITFEDFDGNPVTEEFYFNLTKSEIIELEVDYEGGLEATLKRIIANNDAKNLIKEFKRLVLLSYGVKSEDGKRFVKSDELRLGFSQTNAYDALFMELATNAEKAAEFVNGVMPRDLAALAAAQTPQDKPTGPPPSPLSPPAPPTPPTP
jgi:hypothetical protein